MRSQPPHDPPPTVVYPKPTSEVEANAPTDLNLPSLPLKQVATTDRGFPFLSPPQQADELGRLAHYRVLKLMGVGGMGLVFKAEDELLQRPVALKVMLPERTSDEEARQRFLREARNTAKLHHDHIVHIYQVSEAGGSPFIAMQYLRGMTLGEYLARFTTLTVPQILRVGKEVALGLAAAHKNGLIHRDIKPDNIWLEAPKGRVKLLDFGLARPVKTDQPLTRSGFIVGTPQYMSPEQARNYPLDGRSDLFSLGIVLYLLCTGKLAFEGDTLMATLTALAVHEPEPILEINASIPPDLAQLVHSLLAKKPENRPKSAEELAEQLDVLERKYAASGKSADAVPKRAKKTDPGRRNKRPQPVTELMESSKADPSSLTVNVRRNRRVLWPLFTLVGLGGAVVLALVLVALNQFGEKPKTRITTIEMVQARQTLTGHMQYVRWVSISPDGQWIGSASFDGTARLWDLKTGGLRQVLNGHKAGVEAIVFFPKEPKVATASFDGTVKFWTVPSGSESETLEVHPATVTGLGVSLDGKLLACAGGDRIGQFDIHVVDLETRKKLYTLSGHSGHVTCAEFSPDGRFLATSGVDSVVRIWDLTTRQVKHILSGHQDAIEFACFSPDSQCVASASRDGTVRLWDMNTGKETRRMAEPRGFFCVRFSPDGRFVASAGINGEVRLWEVPSGQTRAILAGHTNSVLHVAYSPDGGTLVSSSLDGKIRIWDVSAYLGGG